MLRHVLDELFRKYLANRPRYIFAFIFGVLDRLTDNEKGSCQLDTSMIIVSPPAPFCSTLLFVVWCGMWQ